MPTESIDTYRARQKLRQIFTEYEFDIEEEVPLTEVTNNMEEEVWPPYQADMLLTKQFIIELDSKVLHGTHRKRIHDKWRDTNVRNQMKIKTVRLISKDVNKQSPDEILDEVNSQLKHQ